MYTIYANGAVLSHPNLYDSGYIVTDAEMTEEVNAHGSLSFTVPQTNPAYTEIGMRTTYITVKDDESEVWRGRVVSIERDWKNSKKVYCEGELAYLVDSLHRPYGFGGGTPAQLFTELITNHNAMVDAARRFTVGRVTVTDYIYDFTSLIRGSWSNPETTWSLIEDRLLDVLGGYIVVRVENSVKYIDYLADPIGNSGQTVEFGENLLDLSHYVSSEDVITCLIPYGATYDQDDPHYQPDPPEDGQWGGNRLTVMDVNGGVDVLKANSQNPDAAFDAVSIWGEVWGTEIWDNVRHPSSLKYFANRFLNTKLLGTLTIDANAVDLSLIDVDIDKIRVCQNVRVISAPHELDLMLICRSKTTRLYNPSENSIVLGSGTISLTDMQKRGKR